MATTRPTRIAREAGIGYWMRRVLAERAKVEIAFAAEPVHDFRVAVRRCRSIAEGLRDLDPHPAWNKMRSAAKAVFKAFGELRDVQVLLEWLERLKADAPAVAARLNAYCLGREEELKASAAMALRAFDEPSWLRWAELLPPRAGRFQPGGDVFQVLALQKWEAARQLHRLALRNRSKTGYHRLRIGIKRLRYLVENFLPEHHALWSGDLKRLQDLLGEVHDLDVLWETSCAQKAFSDDGERAQWRAAIDRERARRLAGYRERMMGRDALWQQWRTGLPSGERLRRAVIRRFALWASLLDGHKSHTRRVVNFSLSLYDTLSGAGLLQSNELETVSRRDLLAIAAAVHEACCDHAGRHHKRARRMLARMAPPPGWTATHMQVLALVARHGSPMMAAGSRRSYRALPRGARRLVDELAAVLRLAGALAGPHEQSIASVRIVVEPGRIAVRAAGYRDGTRSADKIAAARHLLEIVTGLPVVVSA